MKHSNYATQLYDVVIRKGITNADL